MNPVKIPFFVIAIFVVITLFFTLNGCGKVEMFSEPARLAKPLNDTGNNYCRDAKVEGFGFDISTKPKASDQYYNTNSNANRTTKTPSTGNDPNMPLTTSHPKTESSSGTCNDAFPLQDGHFGRDALSRENKLKKMGGGHGGFDWTKLGRTGKVLAEQNVPWRIDGSEKEGFQWSCVRDNHTGLIWEIKSNDSTQFNYTNLQYSWYNANEAENGGSPGLQNLDDCNGIACNTQAYIDALNTMKLCGSDQWRLPTVNEQLTLAISDFVDLAMDKNYFPNAKNDQYWSSQTYVPRRELSWYFYYSDGSAASALKITPVYVRLVHQNVNP